MSFSEIEDMRRSVDVGARPHLVPDDGRLRGYRAAPAPDWQYTDQGELRATTEVGGVTYQRCGGGHRVLRKRIGGN